MAFFSVVIPLYNKENYIEGTINSVLNQAFQDFEIIIVNDGSTDNSIHHISQFQDKRIKVIDQQNQGAATARNKGIEIANSPYIALLDADDIWYKNHLFELKKQIDLFPKSGLYCNNYEICNSENSTRPAVFNFIYGKNCLIVEDFFKASIINAVAWTSAVGFSKEKFQSLGGFNPKMEIAEDLDLWIRFALAYKVCFNPKVTMTYNIYVDNSLSKKEWNKIRYKFVNSYTLAEKENPSLKLYLDINRYAIALRCKMHSEHKLYKKLKRTIDYSNLNLKQKLLLQSPKNLLITVKKIQKFLLKKGIYLTAYK